ncbi:MAG: thioester reductase domain-containing protein [Rhizobiaceae bacterium]|nr:thioester reductase domain-containing protein [Rhizobiaceae bacterium]
MTVTENEPLAIVGIGCRFPGHANDPESFWNLMIEKRSALRDVPADRWNAVRYYGDDRNAAGRVITTRGGFLDHHDRFDAGFFNISPREAVRMDPQQRWLLEVAWETLEDAGMPLRKLRGTETGVFVGISAYEYGTLQTRNTFGTDVHSSSGVALSIASNRISYQFDLKGQSVSVDAACASALVAVHQACTSIWTGECDMVLAGGVNALLTPDGTIGFSKAGMLSPDGECFAFDARANGFARSEGAGLLFIKRLSRARADGDRIYALIRATAANQDGRTSSMLVPGRASQEALMRSAYKRAGIDPNRIAYVEAHGTGTQVGDPIEAGAISSVMAKGRTGGGRFRIGSAKSNTGHLESAAGAVGMVKAALVLSKGIVPPNQNFVTPNPNIPFEEHNVRIPTEAEPLVLDGELPVVGVNSFGFGGSNAHVVLEQAPLSPEKPRPAASADRPLVLAVSARDETALKLLVQKYRRLLARGTENARDVCANAGARREHLTHRLVFIGRGAQELCQRIDAWLGRATDPGVVAGSGSETPPRITFVYSGQGGQWWRMGRDLFAREPVFRDTIERVDAVIRTMADWSLVEELHRPQESSNIDRTDIAQPAIFAIQAGLADLLKSWGVVPARVVGHSVGEVAAALGAGALSFEDAVRVIFHRSRLQHSTAGRGGMAAVGLSEQQARLMISQEPGLDVAAINSASMVTIAGENEALARVLSALEADGVFVRKLPINYAFHTAQMDPIRDDLVASLVGTRPGDGGVPFVSTVTGEVVQGSGIDAAYWWKNVREPVRFEKAIRSCVDLGTDLFIEVGPHSSLVNSVTETVSAMKATATVAHTLRRQQDDSAELLANVARMHIAGVDLDWAALNQSDGRFVRLPSYPWSWKSYWTEAPETEQTRLTPEVSPLVGWRQPGSVALWESLPDPRRLHYLEDHRIWNSIVMPAAAFVEMGLALARHLHPEEPYAVEDVEIERALIVSTENLPYLQTSYDEAERSFAIRSGGKDNEKWERHARGRLVKMPKAEQPPVSLASLTKGLSGPVEHDEFYKGVLDAGYQFGDHFRQIRRIWGGRGRAVAEIVASDALARTAPSSPFHPALIDACLQALTGVVPPDGVTTKNALYLPARFRRVQLVAERVPNHLWVEVRNGEWSHAHGVADMLVYDTYGQLVAEILGFRVERFEQTQSADAPALYQYRWRHGHLRGSRAEGTVSFPPAAAIAGAARAKVPEIYARYDLGYYNDAAARGGEQLSRAYVQSAYRQLGWNPPVGSVFTLDQAMQGLEALQRYRRLVKAQLDNLAQETGVLESVGEDAWRVVWPWSEKTRDDVAAELGGNFSAVEAANPLQKAAGPQLADVMTGAVEPLEVMFPNGSNELAAQFYSEWPDFKAFNELFRIALARAVDAFPERRAIRILEIGAGTGSLTQAILPMLPADRTEFTFTDYGAPFVIAAKQQFARFDFVDYKVFDVEKSPASQGFAPGSFDIVIGSNVVHATQSIRETLDNIRACLAPGGVLMFLESTRHLSSLQNTFGLLDGWWRFTDTDLRKDAPLLSPAEWRRVLQRQGFAEADYFTTSVDESEAVQCVVVARADDAAADATPAVTDEKPRRIVVLADAGGTGTALSDTLARNGWSPVVIEAGEIVVGDEASLAMAVQRAVPDEAPAALIDCRSLDAPAKTGDEIADMLAAQRAGVHHVRALVRTLAARWQDQAPKLVVVTRGVQSVVETDAVERVDASPILGFLRVARNEYPATTFALVDLDQEAATHEVADLADELARPDGETEVAYRHDRRYVNRIRKLADADLADRLENARRADGGIEPFRLQFEKAGTLASLGLNGIERTVPGDDEVEVEVKAAGINFRDLMKVLGMYPGDPIDLKMLGDDFAGVVTRVGANVANVRPGDAVYGISTRSFSSHVIAHHRLVAAKPATVSFPEAATLATVFMTAHYALHWLARMRKGESVLVHAAAGGVGQAAIQIARTIGLDIFATAGSPEKREMAKALGADHVMDSRTLRFADDVMEITKGRGVDAVLNSLSGDFIPKNLSVLAPFGRMLEIGKIDIYADNRIGLGTFRNNLSLMAIDLAQLMQVAPAETAKLFDEVAAKIADGTYRPLPPTVYKVTEAVDAFKLMAQGRHSGKVVLDFDIDPIPVAPSRERPKLFRADAFYLITGGASGVGLEVARWMVGLGARHVALMSRSGPRDDDAARIVAELRGQGVQVLDIRGDVTKADDVRRALAEANQPNAPLKGIFHCAMVLNDEFIRDLDEAAFDVGFMPKLAGAWNLHVASRSMALDHFVSFSSLSALLGGMMQSNYNAGNVFLQSLAQHRRAAGLPGLTVDWDLIRGTGFVERDEKTRLYLERVGLRGVWQDEVIEKLQLLMTKDTAGAGVARIDWPKIMQIYSAVRASKPFEAMSAGRGERGQSAWVREELRNAGQASEARAILLEYLVEQVAQVLDADVSQVQVGKPLSQIGLDSLMAVELVHRVEADLDLTLSMGTVMGGSTLRDLAESILRMVRTDSDGEGGAAAEPARLDPALEKQMTEDSRLADSLRFHAGTPAAMPRRVLLTGATGYLGVYVLKQLLDTSDCEIVCVVRAADEKAGWRRLRQNLAAYDLGVGQATLDQRVKVVAGDLGKSRFGMEREAYEALARATDRVFHIAAHVNHQSDYTTLRDGIVLATRNILDFATYATPAPAVHYLSSLIVFSDVRGVGSEIVTENHMRDEMAGLPGGYSQAKWVTEQMIATARDNGCPVTVYRAGYISGDAVNGFVKPDDFMWRNVKTMLNLGVLPIVDTPMHMTPVDFAARAIVALADRDDGARQTYHLVGDLKATNKDLVEVAQELGYPVRRMPAEEWLKTVSGRINDKALEPIAPYLMAFPEETFRRMLDPQAFPPVAADITMARLEQGGVAPAEPTRDLLKSYLNYLIDIGFLEAPDAAAAERAARKRPSDAAE